MKPLPCPFCGSIPVAQPWHGGGPTKTLVGCENDDCDAKPSVVGSTKARAVRIWNSRFNVRSFADAVYIEMLKNALQTAYSLIIKHHNASNRIEPGSLCPHCTNEDGASPELDQIYDAIHLPAQAEKPAAQEIRP